MRIEEAKALCAKAAEKVSQSWEALIDDEELEQVTQQLHTVEEDINNMKNDLKKMPTTKNMRKDFGLKKLQQQVAKL